MHFCDDPGGRAGYHRRNAAREVGLSVFTVLVVEDEPLIGMDLAETLEERGLVVVGPCRTEVEALAWLADGRPDVAVLDVHLGGRPTSVLAAALVGRHVPFVVITGDPPHALPEAFRAAPYVPKPFDGAVLATLVRRLAAARPPDGR